MGLIRLLYWSRVTKERDPELSKIIEAAVRNNAAHHITGYLAFDRNRFAQVLEGAPGPVSSLYNKIAADPRHREVTLVEVTAIEERSFGAWSVAFCANVDEYRSVLLRYGGNDEFRPDLMTAGALFGLMQSLKSNTTPRIDDIQAA